MLDVTQRDLARQERYTLFHDGWSWMHLTWSEALATLGGLETFAPTKRALIVRERDNATMLTLDPDGA